MSLLENRTVLNKVHALYNRPPQNNRNQTDIIVNLVIHICNRKNRRGEINDSEFREHLRDSGKFQGKKMERIENNHRVSTTKYTTPFNSHDHRESS